jgi:uncharacterized membrane protein YgcG
VLRVASSLQSYHACQFRLLVIGPASVQFVTNTVFVKNDNCGGSCWELKCVYTSSAVDFSSSSSSSSGGGGSSSSSGGDSSSGGGSSSSGSSSITYFLNASRFTMFSVARKNSLSARCTTAGKFGMQ